MSSYDTVKFHCPKCLRVIKTQDKAGPCNLQIFGSASVPLSIADSLHGQKVDCVCGLKFVIRVLGPMRVPLTLVPTNESEPELESVDP
jgi:hypothetical protein